MKGDIKGKWYKDMALGRNSLTNNVKIMTSAFDGNFTNHSLRRTSTTRLFQAGVPEDVIRHHTGHRSNAIAQYKECSNQQRVSVSATLYDENMCHEDRVGDNRVQLNECASAMSAGYETVQCDTVAGLSRQMNVSDQQFNDGHKRELSAVMAGAFNGTFHGCTFNINVTL